VSHRIGDIVRDAAKRIPGARSTVYLSIALRQMAGDAWREPASFDRVFESTPDPWNSRSQSEQERFKITEELLTEAHPGRFGRAFEAGCAEGVFTERLATKCDELIAADYSAVALERAQTRLRRFPHVRVIQWDARRDTPPGSFDLVVAMGVLTALLRPAAVRRACAAFVDALIPGGTLLFSDARQTTMFENAWWGRYVLRGGEQIRRELSRHPQLTCRGTRSTDTHVFAVFAKNAGTLANPAASRSP
jgi:2-polyprenyl-3-methyl-5-hydroxy-6-metoxy-1,4-benzoquinol methylase